MDEGATGAQQPTGVPSESGAQMEGDEPFPTHMTAGERRALAEGIFDDHAAEIFRYLLAWTGDRDEAAELTERVLRRALTRVEQLAEPEADVEARVVALARAAVTRQDDAAEAGGGHPAGAFAPTRPTPLLLAELASLDDARREVLILRQVLDYSTGHAARLLALDEPVVEELEHDACATLWRRLHRAAQTQQVNSWDALTVAAALRQSAPGWLDPLEDSALTTMRDRLLAEVVREPDRSAGAPAAGGGATGAGATGATGWDGAAGVQRRGLLPTVLGFATRRRWLLAGCLASAAIGTVAALAMGQAGESSPCGEQTCVASTTAVAVEDTQAPSLSVPEQQSSRPPTTTTRANAGSTAPVFRSGRTGTTARSTSTTATTTPGPSTSAPRRTTTTTLRQTTTSTGAQTSSTTSSATTGGGGGTG